MRTNNYLNLQKYNEFTTKTKTVLNLFKKNLKNTTKKLNLVIKYFW